MTVIARDDVTLALVTDVASTSRYFQLQASTASAPTAPTVYPAPSPWVTTEPAYTEGATNSLYTVDVTVFSDGSFDYTPVSLSSSYEAAKAAYNKAKQAQSAATQAQTTADGKNKIFSSATQPSSTGLVPGDLWFQLDSSNHVTGIQVWNGSAYVDYVLVAQQVLVAGSVGTISLSNGAVTADKVTASEALLDKLLVRKIVADDIDVGNLAAAVIQSGLFRTGSSGARVEITSAGIKAYDANGNVTFQVDASTGKATMVGGMATALSGKRISISQSGDTGKVALLNDGSELSSLTFIDNTNSSGYVYTGLYTGQNAQFIQFATLVDNVNHQPDPKVYDASITARGKMLLDASNAINVNGTWFAHDQASLPTAPQVVGEQGTKAFADGIEYTFDGSGAWVSQTHIEEMFTPGQWASDYTIVKRASIAGRTVILDLKITRVAPAWTTDGWASAEILKIPASLAPRVSDFTVPAAGNFSEGPTAVGFTIGPSSISVRPIVHCTISPGRFISASICWDF